ncbi:35526_t:CDS:1, partial [Racocetra persica]
PVITMSILFIPYYIENYELVFDYLNEPEDYELASTYSNRPKDCKPILVYSDRHEEYEPTPTC